ncbi:hypothetical protein DSO57_1033697 [Entomophthora muscae]|uniref:Uncharacterized protein n=1 Tax=Entomophthora muscae TaxID=34485 RepID=A0ACC2REX2_9FUNG|nr:hypothetical protein DSO57_1033697 [Entomophthora muscae]
MAATGGPRTTLTTEATNAKVLSFPVLLAKPKARPAPSPQLSFGQTPSQTTTTRVTTETTAEIDPSLQSATAPQSVALSPSQLPRKLLLLSKELLAPLLSWSATWTPKPIQLIYASASVILVSLSKSPYSMTSTAAALATLRSSTGRRRRHKQLSTECITLSPITALLSFSSNLTRSPLGRSLLLVKSPGLLQHLRLAEPPRGLAVALTGLTCQRSHMTDQPDGILVANLLIPLYASAPCILPPYSSSPLPPTSYAC